MSKIKDISKVHPVINIPDGEFLHYVNYHKGEKYADMYVVTEKMSEDKGGYYKSYVDFISVTDNRKVTGNYKEWPSYTIADPVHGSTIESVANLDSNGLNNWRNFTDLTHWHVKYVKENGIGKYEYLTRFKKNGKVIEKKGKMKANPNHPSYDMWATFFTAVRFCDLSTPVEMDTINPVYYSTPSSYVYHKPVRETLKTGAGTFEVFKYLGGPTFNFKFSRLAEDFGFITSNFDIVMEISKEPFHICVEDSDRRVMVKIHTIVGGGDYIIDEISDIKSHPLFKK